MDEFRLSLPSVIPHFYPSPENIKTSEDDWDSLLLFTARINCETSHQTSANRPKDYRILVSPSWRPPTLQSQELECALDQAFPLDLSQETDSNTR